jgi:hypothetical protein
VSGLLASSLDFLQGTFEKIHLQRLVHQHPFELMQFSAKRGLRRTAGDRLCTLVKRRELIPPFVEQSPMDAELLRQRHDVVARLQSLDGHSAEFFRPPTPSLFSHWQFLSLPVCLNELSQIWGSLHVAVCAFWTHPIGGEVRVEVDGELMRSEARRDGAALFELSEQWRIQFQEKGWSSDGSSTK